MYLPMYNVYKYLYCNLQCNMYKSGLTEAVCKLLPYNAQRFEHIRLYFCMLSSTDKVMFCSCHLKVLAIFVEKIDDLNACSLSS